MNMREPKFVSIQYFYWNNEGETIRERINERGQEPPPLVSLDDIKDEGGTNMKGKQKLSQAFLFMARLNVMVYDI
jgi:hypothetical protein